MTNILSFLFIIMLILNFTNDNFENIFNCDKARYTTIFINNNCHMITLLAEFIE